MTPSLLRLRMRSDGAAEPAWLAERDDVWIREALNAVDARIGGAAGDLVAELTKSLAPMASAHGAEVRTLRGVLGVILARCRRETDAAAPPEEVRAALFRAAANARTADEPFATLREKVILAIADKVGSSAAELESSLFADHPSQRIVVLKQMLPTPAEIREDYHLALLQGCLARSSAVTLWVPSQVRAVARFAKLERLLCTFTLEASATRLELSGPLALFHPTMKYGRALASFIPCVVSAPGWRLEAACALPRTEVRICVDASAPLPRRHVLPRAHDSKLEAALERDLRRLRSGWTVLREPAAVHVGTTVFFPDFALVRGDDRVLVEVVGYWTPEYLASKVRALASVRELPLVVVVDAERGIDGGDLPQAEVIPFKRRIDANEVIAASERALAAWRARRAGAAATDGPTGGRIP